MAVSSEGCAFFHSPIRQGGLGVTSFESAIPQLALARLQRLETSSFELARKAGSSTWAERRRHWCRLSKRKNKDWSLALHRMVDGFELREAANVPASTGWIDDPMVYIPPSDWLHYLKVWINALPARIRTTRGPRRRREDVNCRGGCGVQETATHIIQQCFRTHGGRVMRHDAVAAVLASELQRGGYDVRREHVFRTQSGARKPDIIAAKGDRGHILDVQIISGSYPLSEGHKRKQSYYADNKELVGSVAALLQVHQESVDVSTATLT